LNIGLLLVLAKWPWMFNESQIFFVTAMVAGSLMAFVAGISGFRFLVSIKMFLGLAYSAACVWALASVGATPSIQFNQVEIASVVLLPLIAFLLTIGGALISRLTGYHQGKVFSIADVMILVSAVAVLLPIFLKLIPQSEFVASVSIDSIKNAVWFAMTCCGWCLVVTNLFLRFLPDAEHSKTPYQIALGWFLFSAMTSWSQSRFGIVASVWLWFSLLPILGLVKATEFKKNASTRKSDVPIQSEMPPESEALDI
jgi:hypothetical protein